MFYDVFVNLCNKIGKSPSAVAVEIGFQKSVVTRWKKNNANPTDANLAKIADYFNVSVEYLRGNKDTPALTEKDERDIGKKIEDILGLLNQGDGLTFDGNPLSEDALESIKAAMELGMRTAKIEAKAKYTPKKYRNEG